LNLWSLKLWSLIEEFKRLGKQHCFHLNIWRLSFKYVAWSSDDTCRLSSQSNSLDSCKLSLQVFIVTSVQYRMPYMWSCYIFIVCLVTASNALESSVSCFRVSDALKTSSALLCNDLLQWGLFVSTGNDHLRRHPLSLSLSKLLTSNTLISTFKSKSKSSSDGQSASLSSLSSSLGHNWCIVETDSTGNTSTLICRHYQRLSQRKPFSALLYYLPYVAWCIVLLHHLLLCHNQVTCSFGESITSIFKVTSQWCCSRELRKIFFNEVNVQDSIYSTDWCET
jgi:hypothetical protein